MINKAAKHLSMVAALSYATLGSATVAHAQTVSVALAPAREVDAPLVPQAAAPVGDSRAVDEATAGVLLKRAFDFFKNDQNKAAADTFKAAIATGNLNDAGRALAYWHIFVAEEAMGDRNASSDALSDFVVVAQDVMEIREQLRYAEDDSGDFVDRFDLKRRLARARAMLSVAWADHAGWFGRSARAPVPVHSSAEMNYFLELASPCARAHDRHITATGPTPVSTNMSEVDLSCDGGHDKASYFFQVVGEAE